jgi:PKD repeat protein
MKSFIGLCCLFILAVAMASPAAAATANFQANCDSGIPTDCVFDPTRTPSGQTGTSCPGSTVKKYFWDFGDGNSEFVTPPPTQASHTYTAAEADIDVCLTVFCNNNTSATTCHCFSNQFGVNGCIRPGAGWTP